MILGKLRQHLRTKLESKFSPLSQENTMQWILMKRLLSFHYKLCILNCAIYYDNWTNTRLHGSLSRFYLLQKKIE